MAIPGQIYISLSSQPSWTKKQSFLLAETQDIPLEPDPQNAVLGSDRSQWFWAEVPLSLIQREGPNYLALWSPTPEFLSISSAPVLAAAWGDANSKAWLNHSIQGAPPGAADKSLETPLSYFQPALAIKLIPTNSAQVTVGPPEVSPAESPDKKPLLQIAFSAQAENLEWAALEASANGKTWSRQGAYLRQSPFIWTLEKEAFPKGKKLLLRGVTQDILGNQGTGPAVELKK